ncbi:MAG: ArnT family glycosyltransferase, partial [Pyrinomonadaceae bacterium]
MANPQSAILNPHFGAFWMFFAALVIFIYFFGLTIPLVGPDEPRYAQVAREMFERGDWVTPTLGGYNWFEKPPLLYWLQIVSYHVFGVSEFAARFGSAVCGLGTIASLWRLGKTVSAEKLRRGDVGFSNYVLLISASTLGLIVFARGASFDIVLTFTMTASLVAFFVYDARSRRGERQRVLLPLFFFYFFIGVSLLAKGLIGIVFPFAIVALYFLIVRRVPTGRFGGSLIWGTTLAVAVSLLWYLPMYVRHGGEFIDEFFVQHHFTRYTSNKYLHPQPFYFFFWVL